MPWLSEVAAAPAMLPRANTGTLAPLLVDADGKAIESLAAWTKHRAVLKRRWLEFLGPMPTERPAVKLTTVREDRPAGCVRRLVRYEGEPGLFVEGYLLLPVASPLKSSSGKLPGLVALHQTSRDTIDEVAGVKGPAAQHVGLKLCRQGFAVLCPRCFLWQDAADYNSQVAAHRKRHPRTLGMRKMLYDARRGVDVLASLPEVDGERIGACGHSLGAKETLYLAAFDERVKAAVASEGGVGFSFTNWDAPWYLGKGIRKRGFPLNHHQLLALIAPRPFLMLAGEKGRGAADGDRTWHFVNAARPVWELYGKPVRLGVLNHRRGHSIPETAFARWTAWLTAHV